MFSLSFWLWAGLCAALIFALFQLLRQNRFIRDLADAFERESLFLLSHDSGFYRSAPCRLLAKSINRMVLENRRLRGEHAGQVGQLRATFESMQEAVIILNRENHIVLANRSAHKFFPKIGDTGRRIEQLLPNPSFLDFIGQVRKGSLNPNREIEFSSDENSLWVEATGSMIPGLQPDEPKMTLLVLHNITRLKQLESVRRDFVANVSHELRTPLSMIKGYVETLCDEGPDLPPEKQQKFLATVRRHTDRLTLLLEDLLTLSRLESRSRPLQRQILHIEKLVEQLHESYRNRLEQNSQHLKFEFADPAVAVFADPSKILQVLENLLENAVKYSPEQSIITIGTRCESGLVHTWVADNGPGISAEDLPRIFERFYRVDKGRSREKGGTGLGLSIVKHVIQLHGGSVRADSKPGEGTRIEFSLPECREPSKTDEAQLS